MKSYMVLEWNRRNSILDKNIDKLFRIYLETLLNAPDISSIIKLLNQIN